MLATAEAIDQELAAIEAELERRRVRHEKDHAAERLLASIGPSGRQLVPYARYKGLHGGRGGKKSQTFGRLLLYKALKQPGLNWLCAREIQNSLKDSVKKLLDDLIEEFHLEDRFDSKMNEIRTPGGGRFIFNGLQNHTAAAIKSLEGFDGAWVEEAQTLSENSLKVLRPTIRKPGSELWFSWNPKSKKDPVDVLLRGDELPDDSLVLRSSWEDNEFFPDVLRKEMEFDRRRDPDKYAHVWLGGYETKSEARVFRNWRIEDFTPASDVAYLFGADWGFSVDPSVLVRGYVQGRTLYIDAEVYQVGCEIDHTPALFDKLGNGMARNWQIIADSARPETISYMQRHGYPRVEPARKGAGSVEEGITFLQNFDIVVHPRCTNCIDELSTYAYKTHPKTEEILPILDDKKNHVIDAMRYMVEKLHKKEWLMW